MFYYLNIKKQKLYLFVMDSFKNLYTNFMQDIVGITKEQNTL